MSTTKQKTNETPETTVTHNEFTKNLNPEMLNAIEQIENLKSTNKIERALKVIGFEIKVGNEKKDKDGNILYDKEGNTLKWNDRYLIQATSEHGKIDISVKEDQMKAMNVGAWYMAVGHVEIYTPYEGMPKEIIKYDDFQPLFNVGGNA